MSWLRVVFLSAFVSACAAAVLRAPEGRTVSYEGQMVVRCTKDVMPAVDAMGLDIWSRDLDTVMIRVNSEQRAELPASCETVISDVEAAVRAEEVARHAAAPEADWFSAYHRFDDIVAWYKQLAADHSDIVTFVPSIGKSVEGRDIAAIYIDVKGQLNGTSDAAARPTILNQCGIHAREWISPATCMYVANYLVTQRSSDPDVSKLLSSARIAFIASLNPDGYEYTWTNDRLWRKNRASGTFCDGVDLNRNYDDHWAQGGSSSNPCSETYHGPSVASEPEVQHSVDFFRKSAPVYGAIDWHSYSQLLLRPLGWSFEDSPDEAELKPLGDRMQKAIQSVHGEYYTNQRSAELYITTGSASDWFYSEDAYKTNGGVRANGWTFELRPSERSRYGFELPASQIKATGEEMVAGFLVFAQWAVDNPLEWKN